ncbi:MAG: UDP-glucose 4-epimerase GalE [Gaiellaceae bacterium]
MVPAVNLLVVGGAGYVGSVVAARLLEAGHTVTVADSLLTGHRDAVPPEARFLAADLADGPALEALLAEGFDAVLHFAALSIVADSVAEPARYYRANVGGTLNLLDAMRTAGVRRLVFSSTASVYGEPDEVPIDEDAPTRPTNPYGGSKLAADHAIGFECAASGLGAVSLRYFNVAGAYGPYGERHDPESHLVPLVLRAALGELEEVRIYGRDYPTPDGTAVRDYIHVRDLADAHLLALEAAAAPGQRVYNLGNGRGFSVREVVEAARAVTGRPIPAVDAPRRPGDPPVLVASSELIRRELGWVPATPELETIVGDAWAWLRARSPQTA